MIILNKMTFVRALILAVVAYTGSACDGINKEDDDTNAEVEYVEGGYEDDGDQNFDDFDFDDPDSDFAFADEPECEADDEAASEDEYSCFQSYEAAEDVGEEGLTDEDKLLKEPSNTSDTRTYGGPGSRWYLTQVASKKQLKFTETEQKIVYGATYQNMPSSWFSATLAFKKITARKVTVGGDAAAAGFTGVEAGNITWGIDIPGSLFAMMKPVGASSEEDPTLLLMTKTGHCPSVSQEWTYMKIKGKTTGEDPTNDTYYGKIKFKFVNYYDGTSYFSKVKAGGSVVDDIDSYNLSHEKKADQYFGGLISCKKGVGKTKNGDSFYFGYKGESALFKLKDGSMGIMGAYSRTARDFKTTGLGPHNEFVLNKTFAGFAVLPVDGKLTATTISFKPTEYTDNKLYLDISAVSEGNVGAKVADVQVDHVNKASATDTLNGSFIGNIRNAQGAEGRATACMVFKMAFGKGASDYRMMVSCVGMAPQPPSAGIQRVFFFGIDG